MLGILVSFPYKNQNSLTEHFLVMEMLFLIFLPDDDQPQSPSVSSRPGLGSGVGGQGREMLPRL
jgi:hypothetical protein